MNHDFCLPSSRLTKKKTLARCLDSLRDVADEIVVVDSFSIDNTEPNLPEQKRSLIQHAISKDILNQKRFCRKTQAAHHYVLSTRC